MRNPLLALVLAASLAQCGAPDAVDPAQFASAVTLSDALDRASVAYGVPRDLLVAIAWNESRFTLPTPDAHDAADPSHALVELGPLHLRHGGGYDTLAAARAALAVDDTRLRESLGLSVAGAAAALATLGRASGADPSNVETWVDATARFSGISDRQAQLAYASEVFATLRAGVSGTAPSGELVRANAHPSMRPFEALLGVVQVGQFSGDYGPAHWVPASSANYTAGRGGNAVTMIVIHTMQGSYGGSISWFQNAAAQASAHYNIRSSDGDITQMVNERDTAWQAGNWYYNQHSIGIEHEGYVADPGRWYTEAMYQSSARLVRTLCDRYHIPIDRQHIIGHYQVPVSGSGAPCATTATACGGAGNHTDPGNGGSAWNWAHFIDLVNAAGTPPPPPTPAYDATLVGVHCPAEATSGDRPVAYIEYRNTGTATWDTRNTRVGTTGPRDHDGVFFDMVNWTQRNRPSAVDAATAPGAVGRFSFVLGIPEVTADRAVSETYGLVQESVTWFGPADDAARCAVMVHPRVAPPPADAGPPTDTGPVTEPDVAPTDVPEPVDAAPPLGDVIVIPTDAEPPPAGDSGPLPPPVDRDAATDAPTPQGAPVEGSGCGCRTAPVRGPNAGLTMVCVGLALSVARRRRR